MQPTGLRSECTKGAPALDQRLQRVADERRLLFDAGKGLRLRNEIVIESESVRIKIS